MGRRPIAFYHLKSVCTIRESGELKPPQKFVKIHVIANLYRNTTHHTPQQFPPSQRCTCYTRAMLMVGRGSGCAGQKYCFCDYVFAPINGLYTPFPARARSVRPIGIPLYMCSHQSTVNTAVIDISNIYRMS